MSLRRAEYRGRVETPYNEPSRYSDVYICPGGAE